MTPHRKPIVVFHRYPFSEVEDTNPSMASFLEGLVALGHNVVYVSFKEKRPTSACFKGIEFVHLNMVFDRRLARSKFSKSFLFMLLMPWLTRSIVSKYQPALIYCDDSLPFYPFVVKKFSGVRVVARLGDLQTGYYLLGGSRLFRALFRLLHFIEKRCWRAMDGLIPISEAFGHYVNATGVDPQKVTVIPESVNLSKFKPTRESAHLRQRLSLAPTDKIMMFHGAIESLKGLDSLLELSAEWLVPTLGVKLVIVGNGSALERLFLIAQRLGIQNRVIFTGWIPHDLIPDVIALCDVGIPMRSRNPANDFVLTSAVLQYWACGKPVLVPRLKEMTRIMEESGGGICFDFGDKAQFQRALRVLLDNEDLRRTLGTIGMKFAAQNYSSTMVGRNLALAVSAFASGESA